MSKSTKRVLSFVVNLQIILDTIAGSRQRDTADQQYEQYHIGKRRSEIHYLDTYTHVCHVVNCVVCRSSKPHRQKNIVTSDKQEHVHSQIKRPSNSDTWQVTSEMIFPASFLTGAKHSTNHLTDKNYNQWQHKNVDKRARKLLTYAQTTGNETKAWFRGFLCQLVSNRLRRILQLTGLHTADRQMFYVMLSSCVSIHWQVTHFPWRLNALHDTDIDQGPAKQQTQS